MSLYHEHLKMLYRVSQKANIVHIHDLWNYFMGHLSTSFRLGRLNVPRSGWKHISIQYKLLYKRLDYIIRKKYLRNIYEYYLWTKILIKVIPNNFYKSITVKQSNIFGRTNSIITIILSSYNSLLFQINVSQQRMPTIFAFRFSLEIMEFNSPIIIIICCALKAVS